jgi:hypothetical protein
LLSDVPEWIARALEESIKKFAEKKGVGLGKIAQPLRAVSPGIFDVLGVLGRREDLGCIPHQTAGWRGYDRPAAIPASRQIGYSRGGHFATISVSKLLTWKFLCSPAKLDLAAHGGPTRREL